MVVFVEAAKIVNTPAKNFTNYWSPLSCLVEAQEENDDKEEQEDKPTNVEMMLSAHAGDSKLNKVAAHWAQKIANRNTRKTGILDSGATSGAGPEEDADKFEDTGERSTKTFMFPDRRTATATKKMMLKHDLRDGAREMNIVPGMHTSLISISKMADAGYTTVLRQDGAEIYDNKTT
jgi:hypothetical protein